MFQARQAGGSYPIYYQKVVNVENGTLLYQIVHGDCIMIRVSNSLRPTSLLDLSLLFSMIRLCLLKLCQRGYWHWY